MFSKTPICHYCGGGSDECRVVVIETDTGGTLLSRRIGEDAERFNARRYALIDSGRYPNMSEPQLECPDCRGVRLREIEDELEYFRQKSGDYSIED